MLCHVGPDPKLWFESDVLERPRLPAAGADPGPDPRCVSGVFHGTPDKGARVDWVNTSNGQVPNRIIRINALATAKEQSSQVNYMHAVSREIAQA